MIRIVALRITDRIKEAGNTQKALTAHAGAIRARLGFHELSSETCSREAYMVLLLRDEDNGYRSLLDSLETIRGLEVRHVTPTGSSVGTDILPGIIANRTIATLLIDNRETVVTEMQDILSRYGCSIRTRLGLNERVNGRDIGIIVLELTGDTQEQMNLLKRLSESGDITVSAVSFS
ncbi:MAG: hypothetical protein LC649_04020 [Bacteroidales bacterium]|nr:hypothetical protein [Bacteroidales bacterium]